MRGIGYRHVNPVADGRDTLANALVSMAADTRRFARRQRTWLRKVEQAIWLDPAREDSIVECVEGFL
jgi:tRNA A37 N6-isopentenylltransferase MiaA